MGRGCFPVFWCCPQQSGMCFIVFYGTSSSHPHQLSNTWLHFHITSEFHYSSVDDLIIVANIDYCITVRTGFGWDRFATMMISQCDETRNVALNYKALWELLTLLQLIKITFLDIRLTAMRLLYDNCWAAFCRIEESIWLPSYPTLLPHSPIKTLFVQ